MCSNSIPMLRHPIGKYDGHKNRPAVNTPQGLFLQAPVAAVSPAASASAGHWHCFLIVLQHIATSPIGRTTPAAGASAVTSLPNVLLLLPLPGRLMLAQTLLPPLHCRLGLMQKLPAAQRRCSSWHTRSAAAAAAATVILCAAAVAAAAAPPQL
jgi:hypothetical protein